MIIQLEKTRLYMFTFHPRKRRLPLLPFLLLAACAFAFSPAALVRQSAAQLVSVPKISESLQPIFNGSPPRTPEQLRLMENHVKQLAAAVTKCTVGIQYRNSRGSGVIISEDGYVLTVSHVVGIPNVPVTVKLSDGRVARGKALGMHWGYDAGLVKLDSPGPWPYLKISSKQVKPGQWCAASGNPDGFDIRRGPVFRLGRILSTDDELVQTDCQLTGGDSGGPLVDLKGRVIGVNSRIGISLVNNLHVPSAIYRDLWDGLVEAKLWKKRSYIGLRGDSRSARPRVAKVHPSSPAEIAGIKSGDIVTHVDGNPVEKFSELVQSIRSVIPGTTVKLAVERNGKELEFDVLVSVFDEDEQPTNH